MIHLQPKGRLPVGHVTPRAAALSMTIERVGDDVIVRCDSEQFPDFWLEGRCQVTDLLRALEEINDE